MTIFPGSLFDNKFFNNFEKKVLRDFLESRKSVNILEFLSEYDRETINKDLRYGNLGKFFLQNNKY